MTCEVPQPFEKICGVVDKDIDKAVEYVLCLYPKWKPCHVAIRFAEAVALIALRNEGLRP